MIKNKTKKIDSNWNKTVHKWKKYNINKYLILSKKLELKVYIFKQYKFWLIINSLLYMSSFS